MFRLWIRATIRGRTTRVYSTPQDIAIKHYANLHHRTVASVASIDSWSLEAFRGQAFITQEPAVLPCLDSGRPPACAKWFCHEGQEDFDLDLRRPMHSELRASFWQAHAEDVVPLEITTLATDKVSTTSFDRIEAPLSLLLSHLGASSVPSENLHSIYLAQHDLRDLPQQLQDDLPTPHLVKHAGKGDIYSSSLWLGRPPTYTPLHRDPNPNLFVQLAGTKTIRLFRPEVGDAIFEHSQQLLSGVSRHGLQPASASFRGEEMMKGAERSILHDLVWRRPSSRDQNSAIILEHAFEATLGLGQALFIPKGWWHSVKGVGQGITASANWWFR